MSNQARPRVLGWTQILTVIAMLATVFSVMPGSVTPAYASLSARAAAVAVLPALPASTQFDITGFLQSATVNNPADPHSGGTMMINGHSIVVPAETIVILPASALTWQELFAQSPAPYTGVATGMALNDLPKPLTTYEIQAVGNRVGNTYIAGMIHVSQQDLNGGSGYINYIDYSTGAFEVGGTLGVQGTGARIIINDPIEAGTDIPNTGRYTRGSISPDGRFQVDPDNPTIASATGYPMCIPRTDPTGLTPDTLCPETNRPISNGAFAFDFTATPTAAGTYLSMIRMDNPANVDGNPALCQLAVAGLGGCLDPRKQSPMEIGDFVNYAGSVEQDNVGQYISAHTVIDDVAIYTMPGTNPAYVTVEVGISGTGGLTVFGAGEAAIRTRFEGMSTDETRQIHLYGIDINPVTGATSDRDWGTILPDPGPPGGAVRGRWRFRPGCLPFGSVATSKNCVYGPTGGFLPPTREVRAVIEGLQTQDPQNVAAVTTANGIFYGQYHAPIGEYIFPENIPGNPIPENNFNTMDFLAYGGYTSFAGTQVGVLNPWPSNVAPAPISCAVPSIVGGPYSVANGGSINLSGSVNGNASAPVTLAWTAGTIAGGTDLNAKLTNAGTTQPTFNATGLAAGTYFLTFTASNVCGATSAATTITVQAAPVPTINPIANVTASAGAVTTITATSNSTPTPRFTWTQTSGPAAIAFTQAPSAATATVTSSISFTPVTAGTYTFRVTATNANGTSQPTNVTLTVTAATVTNLTITTAEFRTTKQRLDLSVTATDLTVLTMTLQPYMTDTGTMFDPATLGAASLTNTGGGIWTLTIVGAPRPACRLNSTYATPCTQRPLIVKSTGGGAGPGTSVQTALTKIRQ